MLQVGLRLNEEKTLKRYRGCQYNLLKKTIKKFEKENNSRNLGVNYP